MQSGRVRDGRVVVSEHRDDAAARRHALWRQATTKVLRVYKGRQHDAAVGQVWGGGRTVSYARGQGLRLLIQTSLLAVY